MLEEIEVKNLCLMWFGVTARLASIPITCETVSLDLVVVSCSPYVGWRIIEDSDYITCSRDYIEDSAVRDTP